MVCFLKWLKFLHVSHNYSLCTHIYTSMMQVDPVSCVWCVVGDSLLPHTKINNGHKELYEVVKLEGGGRVV